MGTQALATTPHVILRRLSCRALLLGSTRRPNEEPELSWPAFIDLKMERKEAWEGDRFDTMMDVSVPEEMLVRDKRGQVVHDKDGNPRKRWVNRTEQRLEPLSNYGSFVRMIAAACGLKPKSLAKWTEAETMRIAAEVARTIGRKAGAEETARGEKFHYYPDGWQAAQAAALEHGEEQGFWSESK